MANFPFNKLPLEIQRHVWTFAVPTSVVFCVRIILSAAQNYTVAVSPIAKWSPACVEAWNASKAARNCIKAVPTDPKAYTRNGHKYINAPSFPYDPSQDSIYFADDNGYFLNKMELLFKLFHDAYEEVYITSFAVQLVIDNPLATSQSMAHLCWWIAPVNSITIIPLLADNDYETLCKAVSRFKAHLIQMRGKLLYPCVNKRVMAKEIPVYFGEDIGVGFTRRISLHRPTSFGDCEDGSCSIIRVLAELQISAARNPEFYLEAVDIGKEYKYWQWRQT